MHRKNNFDFLRLIFALFIIITHSYPLSGVKECDLMCRLTNGQLLFSNIGLKGFFIISGFLVFQSLERSKSIIEYFWKRVLRLIPGLFVVLLITVLLVPFIYENNSVSYISNQSMWTYIPRNLFLYNIQFAIPGVFETNPYPSTINGSLWTIQYEFTMYIVLSLLFFYRNKITIIKAILIPLFILLVTGNILFSDQLEKYVFILNAKYLLDFAVFFIAGSLLAVLKIERLKPINTVLFLSTALLVISLIFNFYDLIKFIFLPLTIILFGLKSTPILNNIGTKIGDLSYGIYIYAFPIEQTLEHFFRLNQFNLMLATILISIIPAYLSWHLIESKALKLKKLSFFNR